MSLSYLTISDTSLLSSDRAPHLPHRGWPAVMARLPNCRVSHISKASIVGLAGVRYYDSLAGQEVEGSADKEVRFEGEVDRIYLSAPSTLKIADAGGAAGDHTAILVRKQGFQDAGGWVAGWRPGGGRRWLAAGWGVSGGWQHVCPARKARWALNLTVHPCPPLRTRTAPARLPSVVWNPWLYKARALADLGDEDYNHFLCLEVAQARSGAVTLEAGEEWRGGQTLEYAEHTDL